MHWGLPLLQSGRKIWSSLARATPLLSVCLHRQPTALDRPLCNNPFNLEDPDHLQKNIVFATLIKSSTSRSTAVCLPSWPTHCLLLCNSVTYMARPLDPGMALWTHYASVYTYIKESHDLSAIQWWQSATPMSVVKVLLHRVFLMCHICLHPHILKLLTHGGISRPV